MRRSYRWDIVLVAIVATAVFAPGITRYSLVDPWETHYGEVSRMMRQGHDWVHTRWPGTNQDGAQDEGFRSKPVLLFWMEAAAMTVTGVAKDGGYSGEMVASGWTMAVIRMPVVIAAIAALVVMWLMLARLIDRRLAWLALLVVGSSPFYCLIARQGIPDMPMVASTIGALSLFILALEDGDRPISRYRLGKLAFDARHVTFGITCGFVAIQAIYYAWYFATPRDLAVRGNPAVVLPLIMIAMVVGLWRDGWLVVRLPTLILGGIVAVIVKQPMPERSPGQSLWRHVIDDVLAAWDRHSPERYLVRAIARLFVDTWADTLAVSDRVLGMAPITTMRQLYLLGCYSLLGIGVLAKGPPALTMVGGIGFLYVLVFGKWRELYEGGFELKRGLLMLVVTFLPWHLAMFFVEGLTYVNEYLFTHILNRAGDGSVDKSYGTFEHYTQQLGYGLWLWAALVPPALAAAFTRATAKTREGRVRFLIALWVIAGTTLFAIVQTKFHHYILPVVPALGVLVAFYLDDLFAGRERLHPVFALVGVAIVGLVCRDLVYEPDRWVEMFMYRYDRPWPSAEPWAIDPSDGFLVLALAGGVALVVVATPWRRLGVALLGGVGLASCLWSLHVYMPIAGTHWGMREAVRTYYRERDIYGEKLVYFGSGELYDEWHATGDRWGFDTFIPDTLVLGQPMTITVEVRKPDNDKQIEQTFQIIGTVRAIGKHRVELELDHELRARLEPAIQKGEHGPRGRRAIHAVDGDRLLAWQLYWRGENFWSGEEVWDWLPEMKTSFPNSNNADFVKYINDRTRAPIGRRYFVLSEAGKIQAVRASVPTQRGRESFDVIDQTSNKFSLAAFYL